jgi:fatty acid desaturase
MIKRADHAPTFSIREAREIIKDLFQPNPLIYWSDFLASLTVGSACFLLCRRFAAPLSLLQLALFLVSCAAYYRAALFIHELVHLRKGTFCAFRVVWNLLCGIPFLMPTFLYFSHLAHHARKHYGTPDDGEYLPLATSPARAILIYLTQPFLIPVLAIARFLVLAPLAWISPRFRRWVHQRASSLVMDPGYVRPLPTNRELTLWRLQELCCFLLTLGVAVMLITRRIPSSFLLHCYLTAVGVLMLNHVRTLGAHRFQHRGEELTFVEQLLDSFNYPKHGWIAEIWGPVGLRYHALHHLFPSLPYHALPEAHRRLMAKLPADSPYRQTESDSLWASLNQLWRCARASASGTGRGLAGGGFDRRLAGGVADRGGLDRGIAATPEIATAEIAAADDAGVARTL